MNKFKVGDLVKVSPDVDTPYYDWGKYVTHKSIGIVAAVSGGKLYIDFPRHSHWAARASEMVLATEDGRRIRTKDE